MMNKAQRQGKTLPGALSILDTAFLALTGLYLLFLTAGITTFNIPFPEWTERRLLAALAACAALRLIALCMNDRRAWRRLVPGAALAAVYYRVYRADGYLFLLYLAVLTLGLAGIDYRKILKTYLCTAGLLAAAAVVAALTGAITNFVFMKNGYIRSAWGILYPTDFASAVLFALLALWIAWRRLPDWAMLLLALGSMLLAWQIVRGSTSLICSAAFAALVAYRVFERHVVERHGRLRWVKGGVNVLAAAAFVLLALLMFALMALYARRGVNLAVRANRLLSDRLKLAANAWKEHGVHPFGTPFEQVGAGGSTFQALNYNFVDSSYPLILIRYGWVTFIALAAVWTLGVIRAIRAGDRRLALAMALIALHSFSEHHFTEVNFNILLAMPLAAFPALSDEAPARDRRRAWAAALTGAVCAALIPMLPLAISMLRTAFQALDITGGGKRSLAVIAAILAAGAVAAVFIRAIYRLLAARLGGEGWPKRALAALAACLVLVGGTALFCDGMIARAAEENAALLDAEAPALEAVTANASGRVYSDALPEVYRRRFGGISRAMLSGEDLARLYGVTVVMEDWRECNPFLESGFLYAPISEAHAVYTNDAAAIAALEAAGVRLTGYYSKAWQADMAWEAEINNLDYAPDGLEIEGFDRALAAGPYADLYEGRYTVAFDLRLDEAALAADIAAGDTVCELDVTAYWGQEVLLSKSVARKRFGDGGALTVEIPFKTDGCRGVEFQAFAVGDCPVIVEGIAWRRTPKYDVHAFYDARRREVRSEYYSLEGEPVLTGEGYFAREYGYDADGNRCLTRYLGADGQPVVLGDGYAERRREFNARGQIVRESFYGADGLPVLLAKGYAAIERDYDERGNVVAVRYFGLDGAPATVPAGYAALRREYNEAREVTREAYFGADGLPVVLAKGYAAVEREYDAAGNAVAVRYLGADGLPVALGEGYAERRREYNGMRQVVREAYFGADGQPVERKKGFAAVEKEYDDAGNVVVLRYFGADGRPKVITSGYAELRREYDRKQRLTRVEYYGADGALINLKKKGYAIIERDYDDAGKNIARRYYDASGALVKEWKKKKK